MTESIVNYVYMDDVVDKSASAVKKGNVYLYGEFDDEFVMGDSYSLELQLETIVNILLQKSRVIKRICMPFTFVSICKWIKKDALKRWELVMKGTSKTLPGLAINKRYV